jgi:predicted enzyme related to lactoylglutathione lyase
VPVTEIPDMVTFALFADPEGHVVGIYKGQGQS